MSEQKYSKNDEMAEDPPGEHRSKAPANVALRWSWMQVHGRRSKRIWTCTQSRWWFVSSVSSQGGANDRVGDGVKELANN